MLKDLQEILNHCRTLRRTDGLSIIVSIDDAVRLMREVLVRDHKDVRFTNDPDELFVYDGVPVRLRVRSTAGVAMLTKTVNVPSRECCDITATTAIAMSMSWRKS